EAAAPALGDRLDLEHPREHGPSGEVAGEERLLAAEPPPTTRQAPRDQLDDLVEEQERRPMGQYVGRPGQRRLGHQAGNAASSLVGVSLREILYQTSSRLPSSSTRKA